MSTVRILGLVLVAQVVLAIVTWWPTDRTALTPHALLEIDAAAVDQLAIAPSAGESEALDWLVLERGDDGWAIASEGGYPADAAKVDQLIDRLVGMEVRAPIATSRPSHNALKVGERDYGRRVRITSASGEQELVVGAAQSNSVHVRFADRDDVYLANGLSEFALSNAPASYWDRQYVSAPAAEITSFTVENENGVLRLERVEDDWTLMDPPPATRTDPEAIDEFLAGVTNLRLIEPVGVEAPADAGLNDGPRIAWTLEAEDQSVAGGYVVGAKDGGNAFVKADDSAFVVKVSAAAVEPLRKASVDDFVVYVEQIDATGSAPEAPSE